MVKAGDPIPPLDLVEDYPGNLVNLSEELETGNGLIIGVPAAFSMVFFGSGGSLRLSTKGTSGPSCSNSHVPGFMNHPKLKDAGKVFVVAVNDPFV